jgi:hypothetical protein
MSEFLKPNDQESVKKRVLNFVTFALSEDEPSEYVESLIAPGRVEQLVREGRTPLQIGEIGPAGKKRQPYYQVPPQGFDPDNLSRVFGSMGVWVFVNKLGIKRIGSTYTLTEEQSKQVEGRIEAELTRLGKGRSDVIHLE